MIRLFTADLHFTDSPNDEYRWGVIDSLKKHIEASKAQQVVIAGDLTERKNNHSSKLTNRIVSFVEELRDCVRKFSKKPYEFNQIIFIKGNHDYTEPSEPYFNFLNEFEGVSYITDTTWLNADEEYPLLCIPNGNAFPNNTFYDLPKHRDNIRIVMHHSVLGAKLASGFEMNKGIDVELLPKDAVILSGHIHVPQTLGNVTYIGSPYPVDFGDTFTGRFLIQTGSTFTSFDNPSIKKLKVKINVGDDFKILDKLDLVEGDKVVIEISVKGDDVKDFNSYRSRLLIFLEDLGVEVRECVINFKMGTVSREIVRKDEQDKKSFIESMCIAYKDKMRLSDKSYTISNEIVKTCLKEDI